MYIVQWNDREGNLQERAFRCLEDARMEAAGLREEYDYVEVVYREDAR